MTNFVSAQPRVKGADRHTLLRMARQDILGRGEEHEDLTDRDRDPRKTIKIINKCKIGCLVTNFVGV